MTTQDRIQKATALFKQGFNCAQSVAGAFADYYGIDEKTMLRLATGFGGGIGRMRETCGAACGMFILCGLEKGFCEAPNTEAKGECYALVQKLAAEFEQECGSLICADLLGLPRNGERPSRPEERTAEYYKKRPCADMVATAARIYAHYLETK